MMMLGQNSHFLACCLMEISEILRIVIPANAGIQVRFRTVGVWIPAFAGMTV